MKTLIRYVLVISFTFSALACGGEVPGAGPNPQAQAAAQLPEQPGEIHFQAIDQSLMQSGQQDTAREQCGPPQIDQFGMCSQLCCVKVWIWGMEACWLAPTPGACTSQVP